MRKCQHQGHNLERSWAASPHTGQRLPQVFRATESEVLRLPGSLQHNATELSLGSCELIWRWQLNYKALPKNRLEQRPMKCSKSLQLLMLTLQRQGRWGRSLHCTFTAPGSGLCYGKSESLCPLQAEPKDKKPQSWTPPWLSASSWRYVRGLETAKRWQLVISNLRGICTAQDKVRIGLSVDT